MMLFRRTLATTASTAARSASTSSSSASSSSSSSSSSASSSTPSTSTSRPDFFKVQLTRSAIGLRPEVRKTVTALGFKKRMQTVYTPVTQGAVGKLLQIKELIKVETVSRQTMEQETAPKDRSLNRGYTVIGKAFS